MIYFNTEYNLIWMKPAGQSYLERMKGHKVNFLIEKYILHGFFPRLSQQQQKMIRFALAFTLLYLF